MCVCAHICSHTHNLKVRSPASIHFVPLYNHPLPTGSVPPCSVNGICSATMVPESQIICMGLFSHTPSCLLPQTIVTPGPGRPLSPCGFQVSICPPQRRSSASRTQGCSCGFLGASSLAGFWPSVWASPSSFWSPEHPASLSPLLAFLRYIPGSNPRPGCACVVLHWQLGSHGRGLEPSSRLISEKSQL